MLDTLRVMAWLQQRWGPASCGRYVVSFSQPADHLVAVRALARLAVGDKPLDSTSCRCSRPARTCAAATGVLEGWMALESTRAWLAARAPGTSR